MKITVYILLFFMCNFTIAQKNTVMINGNLFDFINTEFNDTLQAEFVKIYKKDEKIVTHTIAHFDGDCSSENIELGSYEIKDNTIIFYSYWAGGDRMGRNIYPFGFRKQIYTVAKDGLVSLLSSSIYLEAYVDSYQVHSGMKFLIDTPTTEVEKKSLQDYITKVEKMYAVKFAFRAEKVALEKEVREKLKSDIEENTRHWNEVYNGNFNM